MTTPVTSSSSPSDAGEIPEEHKYLVKHVLRPVRPIKVRMPIRGCAQHMIVCEQMRKAEIFYSLRVRTYLARISADLGLREDNPDPHRFTLA
jgi:hypothetical protein